MARLSRALPVALLLSLAGAGCDSSVPGGADGVCATAGFTYVEFEELMLNLPRYAGADIIVDGYVKAGVKSCRNETSCDCSAEALLHDGVTRDLPHQALLLAPGDSGERYAACSPDASCNMVCEPGPQKRLRVVGKLSRVVEDEGEVVISVQRACAL